MCHEGRSVAQHAGPPDTGYGANQPVPSAVNESVCNSTLLPQITPAVWQCYFQSSCRQVFEHNVCNTPNTSYKCN